MDSKTIMLLAEGLRETVYMTLVSTFLGYVIGLPVGILLTVTDKDGIKPNAFIYRILDVIINISFPDPADPADPIYQIPGRKELRYDGYDRSAGRIGGTLHCAYGGILTERSGCGSY